MPGQDTISLFTIKVNGSPVSAEFMRDTMEVVVDTNLYLPDMFTIQLHDDTLTWADGELLKVGNKVEVSAETSGQGGRQGNQATLIKGEITALEPDFSSTGQAVLVMRGYVKGQRLHRGKKARTFLKMSDSDIASKIAQEVGLTPSVDSTSVRYDYVLQNNQTNMEFLLTRAERIGYQVYVKDETLYFKKGTANHQGQGPELEWKKNLKSFRPRLAATHQADQFVVRGWDAKAKKAITSQVTPSNNGRQGGVQQTGGAMAQQAFGGSAQAIVVDQPVSTADEAKAMAQAICDEVSGDFVQAEGTCVGDSSLRAGQVVRIKGVGTRFSGNYFVTAATHVYKNGVYETHFSMTGRRPDTLGELLAPKDGDGDGLVKGVVTAMVTNLNDPDNLGRVKVKYPWLDDSVESDWVRIATPMAGAQRGFYYLPEVNDEVLIAFEHGDPHRPYIVGALWSNTDKPPKPNSEVCGGGKVNKRILKSRSGHIITLNDTDGQEEISIIDKTGKNQIVIKSPDNSMQIKVQGDLTIEAQGKITIKGAKGVDVISQAQLKLSGQSGAELSSPAQTVVKGSAMVNVSGGMIKLN
jgi:phage protein D/phage baseplate assembly protein gpV